MGYKFPPRVRMTTATTGTGPITVGSALSGSQALRADCDGEWIDYTIVDGANWEEGRGRYTHATKILNREIVFASTAAFDGNINLSGNAVVFSTIASATMEGLIGGVDELVPLTTFPAANLVDITDIPQTYRALQLYVLNASSTVASRRLTLRVSPDNGATFYASAYRTSVMNNAGAVDGLTGNLAFPPVTQAAADTDVRSVIITGYQEGAYTHACFSGAQSLAGVSTMYHGQGAYIGDRLATDALRLLWNSTGNFDGGGQYGLYGIR